MNAPPSGLISSWLLGDLGGGAYPTLCWRCHRMLLLPPDDAVLAEARAAIGDLTIVFCAVCRQPTSEHPDDGQAANL